jgi:hypothetical protein
MTNARHQNLFPRAWASSTPPTCAVLDGQRYALTFPLAVSLSDHSGKRGQKNAIQNTPAMTAQAIANQKTKVTRCTASSRAISLSVSIGRTQGEYFSWVNQKGILPSRLTKTGAINFNPVQWIALRHCMFAPRAGSGQKRPPKIGPPQRKCSLARSSTGLQATRFQTRGAWRLSVCSHSPRRIFTSNREVKNE